MNKIQKQKGWLIAISVIVLVLSIASICGGVVLLTSGIKGVNDANNAGAIVKIVFGALLSLAFAPGIVLGFRYLWVGLYMTATKGSIAEGNIAKEGGTVNIKKCDKCGTELKDGETVCSECGKSFEKPAEEKPAEKPQESVENKEEK